MKFLIVQLGRIGDTILLTPILSALRHVYPDSEINLLTGRAGYACVQNNPFLNRVFIWDKSPFKLIRTIFAIRADRYDYLIDPKDHYSSESRFIARFVKAGEKIGFNPLGKKKVFTQSVPSDKENAVLHCVQRNFNALKILGVECPASLPKPELFVGNSASEKLDAFLDGNKISNYIVTNISASKEQKMWQKDKWVELLNKYKSDYTFIISSAPAEAETAELISAATGVQYFRSSSMQDVSALISRANMLISPDTSLVHVAAAFNIPLLGLFSGINREFKKFHPLSDKSVCIKAEEGIDGIQTIPVELLSDGFDIFARELKK